MNNAPRALIATALSLEFKAMRAHLRDVRDAVHPQGTIYEVGMIAVGGVTWEVILLESGPTNVRATLETERALHYFNPKLAFFVGVAGGLKDVKLGDVVAATKVYGFESAKADVDMKPRLDFADSDYRLEQIAKSISRNDTWFNRALHLTTSPTNPPEAKVGPIASGEKVVSSEKSAIYAYLRQNCSDALAVEMEGYGFLSSVRANSQVAALVVRGISDLVEGKSDADDSGSQPIAASYAAAFVVEVLDKFSQHHINTSPTCPTPSMVEVDANSLLPLLAELYPQGPQDQSIWERAGGDLAQLDLTQNGRTQWFSALKTLQAGGGGRNITMQSLFQCLVVDFPQNPKIKLLATNSPSNEL